VINSVCSTPILCYYAAVLWSVLNVYGLARPSVGLSVPYMLVTPKRNKKLSYRLETGPVRASAIHFFVAKLLPIA